MEPVGPYFRVSLDRLLLRVTAGGQTFVNVRIDFCGEVSTVHIPSRSFLLRVPSIAAEVVIARATRRDGCGWRRGRRRHARRACGGRRDRVGRRRRRVLVSVTRVQVENRQGESRAMCVNRLLSVVRPT